MCKAQKCPQGNPPATCVWSGVRPLATDATSKGEPFEARGLTPKGE